MCKKNKVVDVAAAAAAKEHITIHKYYIFAINLIYFFMKWKKEE
jgi:hypothetical protein